MNLYQSIFKRKSTRAYSKENLSEDKLKQIEEISSNTQGLFDIEVNINLIKDGKEIFEVMKGLLGNIGKISAPHYLVVTSEIKDGYLENSGYMLEEIVLKLTEMGLATCWLGGHLEKDNVTHLIDISPNHEVMFMIALGYPEENNDLYRDDLENIKRKDISDFVINSMQLAENSLKEEIFSAVRVAPSAANSQPWRFKVNENTIHVFMKKRGFIKKRFFGKINLVDIGIALKHLEIAAKHFDYTIKFNFYKNVEESKLNYIISADLFFKDSNKQ